MSVEHDTTDTTGPSRGTLAALLAEAVALGLVERSGSDGGAVAILSILAADRLGLEPALGEKAPAEGLAGMHLERF